MKRLLLVLCVVAGSSGQSFGGGHGCCADCGCGHGLRKVCRWECEEVEVKVPSWDCECEDVVIPGKSSFCAKRDCGCNGGCNGGNGCCNSCAAGCSEGCGDGCGCGHCGHACVAHLGGCLHHKKEWGPPCGCHVKTINVLVRTEKTIKKKVWKPVIEDVCASCCNNCGTGCGNGPCAAGAPMEGAPMDGAPMGPPAMAPDSNLPIPPLPPDAAPPKQTSRRGLNPLLSAFKPAKRQR